jgi:hypothetical protein
MSYTDWVPGHFPIDDLASLGDGEFLCAVLGDGKRYSNVSRVTIDHNFKYDAKAVIRIVPIAYPEQKFRRFLLWVVPGPGQAIYPYDVCNSYLCLNGIWTELEWPWSGPNEKIPIGQGYAVIGGIGNRQPPLQPFEKGEMQVKIISNGLEQRASLPPLQPAQDIAQEMKDRVGRLNGYLSPVVSATYDDTDDRAFDAAFNAN